jgi:ubiquinone biosynthesis protein UbiJ
MVKAIQEESAEKDIKLNDQAKEIKALKERLNLFEKRLNQMTNKMK